MNPVLRKAAINVFLLIWVPSVCLDALPTANKLHDWLKQALKPAQAGFGVLQEDWELFSPVPRKENIRVRAYLSCRDGSTFMWQSPEWRNMSAWKRFVTFREEEFVDSIRLDDNSAAWEGFSSYLAEQSKNSVCSSGVLKIDLVREWANVPPPIPDTFVPFGAEIPIAEHYKFYTRSLS